MDSSDATPEQAASLLAAAEVAESRGDLVTAEAAYEALAETPDSGMAADARFRLGVLAWRQSRLDRALAEFGQARELARTARRTDLEARAHNGEGNVHCQRGEYGQARASYYVAMTVTDDPILHARSLQNLGVLANIEGDLETALQFYSRARRIFHEHGDRPNEALVAHNAAMLHADRRDWDEADDLYRQALSLFETQSDMAMIAAVLANRSEVLSARGLAAEAASECQRAIAVYAELGDEVGRAEAQRWLGHALRLQGELPAAARVLGEAIQVAVHHRIRLLEAECSREMALLARAGGDDREAGAWRERALALFRALGAAREIAEME